MKNEAGSFSRFRTDVSRCPPLDAETEARLARAWQAGDRRAGDRIISSCLPFVMTLALEYRRWGLPMEDIVQEGNVGLLKAAVRFDPDRGCRLATYAAYWIRAEIREFVARGYRIVRLGSSKGERRALRSYRRTHERDPAALAELAGVTKERAEQLLPLLVARDVCLDRTTDDGSTPLDNLASADLNPEEQVCAADQSTRLQDAVGALLKDLEPRDRVIVQSRWLTEQPATLEDLGAKFGVSKERVRQLEERVRSRLRERLGTLEAKAA